MEDKTDLYSEHYLEFARISRYQFQKAFVIILLVIAAGLSTFLWFTSEILGIIIAIFALVNIFLRLWVKHTIICPSCKKSFFGRFQIFMSYTSHCKNCGLSLVPPHPVKLKIDKM